ncbi:HemK [Schleiferilactobacillus shenzhenensis LY-73]|uniref:HemK n=2 Tax=Schleiferilactobacillus shenzhenensis TaxID=1231337 RepID=U4TLN5_9LACO|nr:HemK [Schleiferilactobacillus shenzhenensis LY-73]
MSVNPTKKGSLNFMDITYQGTTLRFTSNAEVFSPRGLDQGTETMLNHAEVHANDRILDLGCGFGFVGVYFAATKPEARVTMADVDGNAVALAKENAEQNHVTPMISQSDGFAAIRDARFDVILSNPPYHENFSVPKHFIEGAYRQLAPNGRLYMVTKRRTWYENKIRTVFGGVHVIEDNGYFVFAAQKRIGEHRGHTHEKQHTLSKKLQRKQARLARNQ